MIGFDLFWKEQEEKLIEEGFSWEEIQAIKELAESEYERGYEIGRRGYDNE